MIDKVKFYKGMTLLKSSFAQSKVELTEETLEIWTQALFDLTDDMFEVAVLHIIRNSKFFPTIAEIRETAFNLCTEKYAKTGDEAWGEVMQQIALTGSWGEPKFKDEITAQAVKNLGWMEICQMDLSQLEIIRAQFRNLYNNLKQRSKNTQELEKINPAMAAMLKQDQQKMIGNK